MKPRSGVRKVFFVIVLLAFCLALLNCGGVGSTSKPGEVTLISITIAPAAPTIPKGMSVQLSATANYSDGTHQATSTSVVWQTAQTSIAAINATGNVIGMGQGITQVSATYQGVTGSTTVTIGPASLISIAVAPSSASLPIGESEQLVATGSFSDGSVQNLTQTVTWNCSAVAVASINPGGTALASATGTTTISATSGSVTGSASLTVTPAVVTAVNIVPTTVSLVLEGSRQLQAIATWSDGTTKDVTSTATWSSGSTLIANVSNTGVVTAQQVGSTTVAATESGQMGSASLTVMPLLYIHYYDRAAAKTSRMDGFINLVNPGLTNSDLCAMVYVFDENEELNECCGCSLPDSGLRTLSLLHDLTANPLTGVKSDAGLVMIIPSERSSNPKCDPAALSPTGAITGWETNDQASTNETFQVTESGFAAVPLSSGNASTLPNLCGFIESNGGSHGICKCGMGN